MKECEKINYIELPSRDLEKTKAFFSEAFGWTFTDYGPEYSAFSNAGLDGGFFQAELHSATENGATLVVLYSRDLEGTLEKVTRCGASIAKPIFTFPGGRRFHFKEPCGNEFAVWSDVESQSEEL
ncbi:VOC family protein [Microbulbifer sp. OS29]|uniref:VOC family protein n=1 Tax=Microbulbifer okhotskensis TaxID=2926617 RepID=A0A9X2EP34_9GAMM|nr:VOC family protein [Microbulbifer okhotskensis]MCO1335231.1 VOC family protein [Microbulbifer okhotskensis]